MNTSHHARDINHVLTESLPYLAESEQFQVLGDDQPETDPVFIVDFLLGSLLLQIHRGKSDSSRRMVIQTRPVSPHNHITFDQSPEAVLKAISRSLRADLWKNKGKFMNLSTLNFLLLLANVLYTILSSGKQKRRVGYPGQNPRTERSNVLKKSKKSLPKRVISSFKSNLFSIFRKKK